MNYKQVQICGEKFKLDIFQGILSFKWDLEKRFELTANFASM